MTLPAPGRGTAETVGSLLTWIGGGISVVLLGVVALVSFLAWYVVGNGIDVGSGRFACRDQACFDMWTSALVIGVGMAALLMMLIILAIRSSSRSLLAATVIGSVVGAVLVGLVFATWSEQGRYAVTISLLFFAAGPVPLVIGSVLRLWARLPETGRSQGGRGRWSA